jgi:hypothetical protein
MLVPGRMQELCRKPSHHFYFLHRTSSLSLTMTKLMHECLVTIADEDIANDPLAQFMRKFGMDPEGCRSIKLSLIVPLNASTTDHARIMLADLTACLCELDNNYPEKAAKLKRSKDALENSIALYSEHHEKPFDVNDFIDCFIEAHS